MVFFENTRSVRIGTRDITIRRAGMLYLYRLITAAQAMDFNQMIQALPPFLLSPISGKWTGNDISQLSNTVISFNITLRKKFKKKDPDPDQPEMSFEEILEFIVLRVAGILKKPSHEIAESVSLVEAVEYLEHHKKYLEEENIRWMMNIAYGYSGQIQDYIDSLKYTEENLEKWAIDRGYESWHAFEEAEKKRWS